MATRRRPQLRWQPPTTPRCHIRMNKRGRRLETLFDEERVFGKNGTDVPPVVVLHAGPPDDKEEVAGVETEMLRAECRFLRMERELALKKLKRRMERILRSALQTLVSGRDKLGACTIVRESLDDEIEAMRSKLLELQTVSISRTKIFKAAALDDRPFPSHHIPPQIQQLAEASFRTENSGITSLGSSSRFTDVSTMELSKAGRSSVATSATAEMPDVSINQQGICQLQEEEGEEEPCCGRCRAVVLRVVTEQVRFETEQWSQVQEMLEKVKEEMEELQTSRDKWQQRALFSQDHIFSLNSTVEAWKKRVLSEEAKVNDLKTQVQVLHEELKMAMEGARANNLSTRNDSTPTEKQVLTYQQQKENHNQKNGNNRRLGALREEKKKLQVQKRSPFLDIGNSSPLMRQITKVVFPGHKI